MLCSQLSSLFKNHYLIGYHDFNYLSEEVLLGLHETLNKWCTPPVRDVEFVIYIAKYHLRPRSHHWSNQHYFE